MYGVIHTKSIHHPGDERSWTHPGHGYPAYTETVSVFKSFETETELTDWIEQNSCEVFQAIKYEKLKVTVETHIHVH